MNLKRNSVPQGIKNVQSTSEADNEESMVVGDRLLAGDCEAESFSGSIECVLA